MTTTAYQVAQLCSAQDVVAVTLQSGYLVAGRGERTLFEPARIDHERRNAGGRVIRCRAAFKDGSTLLFTWSPTRGASYLPELH